MEVTDVNVVTLTLTNRPCPPVKLTGQEAGILSSLLSNARHTSGHHASTDRNEFVEALNLQDEPIEPLKLIKQWKASIAKTSDRKGKGIGYQPYTYWPVNTIKQDCSIKNY